MTAPRRGSVAGQPIVSQAQTQAFDEGFDRVFGERKPGRGRYVYRPNPETGEVQAVSVDEDWTDAPRSTGDLGKFEYDNLQATDGADISSRTKHREYMKASGTTMASDFKETWARAEKDRAAYLKGERVDAGHREAIGRAEYELSKRKGRK